MGISVADSSPLLIFGGTFNPIHLGHLSMARQTLDFFGASRMLLVPSAEPPHRATPSVTVDDRLAMARLAAKEDPRLQVDDREVRRGGRSYTVDTLADIRSEYGLDRPLIFCLGSDAFNGITTWHEWNRLFDLAHICVISRPDQVVELNKCAREVFDARVATSASELLKQPVGGIIGVDCEPDSASSTQIRERIRQGKSCELLLTKAVYDYIMDRQLYR